MQAQEIQRQSIRHVAPLRATAQSAWNVVSDWGHLDWYGWGVLPPGTKLVTVTLEEQSGNCLATRMVHVASDPPMRIRESLVVSDSECFRLYFTANDGFIPGIKNYISSWAFSSTAEGGCTMLIESTFDVVNQGQGDQTREAMEGAYALISTSLDNYMSAL